MASTVYDVKIDMHVDSARGQRGLSAMNRSLAATQRQADMTQRALGRAARNFNAAFNVGATYMAVRKMGSALFDFTSKVEQAQTTFTGLFQMNYGGTFESNMTKARRLVNMYVQDAKTSLGTTEDFMRMGENIVGPLSQVGASIKDIREITKGAVVAAQAFGINSNVAGMDIQQAIQGRMTLRDRLPKLLGLDPESWNKMARKNPQEALQKLRAILTQPALKSMAEAQSKTFTGSLSRMKDTIAITLGKVGTPLMRALADEFQRISKWIDANPKAVSEIATSIASGLTKAFSIMRSAMGFLWRNRETLMFFAKALLAFKAVKGISGAIGGMFGPFSSALSSATGSVSTFGSSLDRIANRLGLAGLAGYVGYKAGGALGDVGRGAVDALWQEEITGSAKQDVAWRKSLGLSPTASGSEVVKALEERKYGTRMLEGLGGKDRSWIQRKMFGSDTPGSQAWVGSARAKLGLDEETAVSMANMRSLTAGARGSSTAQGIKSGTDKIADAAARMMMMQNKMLSATDAKINVERLGLVEVLALAQKFKGTAEGAGLAGADVVQAINVMKNLIAGNPQGGPLGNGKGGPLGPGANIHVNMKVEVKSDDPDRFVMDLGKAFELAVKSPSSAYTAFREG